ncbi:MAG: hypothetical protein JKX71_02245 [Amylibacter sp.]|nr:hypothetical protein [Amylibacter sp.]
MIMPRQMKINDEIIDIAAIEANARKMRAQAMAEFGHNLRVWFKNLSFGFPTRTAH